MIGKKKGGLLMPVMLVTACGTLVWMLASMWLSSGDGDVAPVAAKPVKIQDLEGLAAELRFNMPPQSHYDGILDRPIFSSSRRGVEETVATPTVVVSRELKLKLTGTTISDSQKFAVLVPKDGGEALNLREGEDYQGWTLARVKNGIAVFRRNGAEERLEMDFVEPPTQVSKRRRNRRNADQADERQNQRTLSRSQQNNQNRLRTRTLSEEDPEGDDEDDEDQQ